MTFGKVFGIVAALMLAGPLHAQDAESFEGRRPDPGPTVPATLDADGKAAVDGINAFSLDLYRRTLVADDNHFVSPASVSVAVGLAYRGAKGATATELEKTMRFGKPPADYLRANGQVLATMELSAPLRELHAANSVWLQEGMPLVPDFEQDIARFTRAGIQRVDFRKDAEAARTEINDWVADKTRDRIKNLLLPVDLTKKTRAILVNAIYFKGAWAEPFAKGATRIEPFTLLDGEMGTAPLMTQRRDFQAIERGGVKAILLPYAGHEIEMAVFLPGSPKGLPRFEEKLTAAGLTRWLADLAAARPRDTILSLPKMHMEWRGELQGRLAAMGAPTAFSDDADFSGMASVDYPGEEPDAVGLKIRKVIHKTFLDVDEAGSEAAAATAVVVDIVVTAARKGPPPPPPFIFRADKPFLFLLRDRRTGLILFMGRYVVPEKPS